MKVQILNTENLLSESSLDSVGGDSNDLGVNLEAKLLEHSLGLLVDLEGTVVLGQVQGGNLWNVLVLSLSLLLLELERDTSHWTLLNSLHKVGGVTSDLVSESLGLDLSDLRGESLVGLEVQSKLWVVLLNEDLGGSLNGLSSNSTL